MNDRNKETFLKELREYLKILEDKEQEDILAEYAQHIDMKMQKGLSEEEAIRDFGPMEELAAEILEAYHVKPEFNRKEDRKKDSVLLPKIKKSMAGGGRLFARFGRFTKEKFLAFIFCIGRGFCWLGQKIHAFALWLTGPFRKKKEQADGTGHQMPQKGTKDMTVQADSFDKTFFGTIGHGIRAIWQALVSLCIWGLKLLWNCGWLMISLITAVMTMVTLMGFGMVLVLLLQQQGYPFKGVLLMCLGGILCFASLTCAAFSLIIRKKKDSTGIAGKTDKIGSDENGKKDERGEVQYE
ncbi:MAG: DUF1700 domain-containing protein [Roseburia sp.]|nr:DUF1700 domain-containing protein [Roseburia sp.]MCM1242148.1 DUF1700 domain-containing protein [Roseburia sp.]